MPTRFDPSESSASAQLALAKKYAPIVGALSDPFMPPGIRTAMALKLCSDVLDNLASYTRLPIPERPVDLDGYADVQLVDKIKFIVASTRATPDERALVPLFTAWRYAILLIESQNAGRVETLLYCATKLSAVAKEHGEQARDLEHLGVFLDAEWGVKIDPLPTFGEARAVAYYVATEREALPNCLRTLESPTYVSAPKREPSRASGSWMQDFETKQESGQA